MKDKKGKTALDSKRENDIIETGNVRDKTAQDITEAYRRLRDKNEEKLKEIARLQEDLDKRQERFMKRRGKLQEILGELEKDLNVRLGKETVKNENEMKMKGKQVEIGDLIDAIPQKTKKMIDGEMEEYSKAFNTQVQNMKKEMNAYLTNKKEEENSAKKQEDLRMQLGLMYKATEKIDRENTKLMADCKRFEEDFKKQEETRLKLFQELVDQKRENANLLEQIAYFKLAITEVKEGEEEPSPEQNRVMQSSFMSASSKKSKAAGSFSGAPGSRMKSAYQSAYPLSVGKDWKDEKEMIERYKNVITRQQDTLEQEKKGLKRARLLYAKEMQAKTELEELLGQCVEEVRSEFVGKKPADRPSAAGTNFAFILVVRKKPVPDKLEFTKEQREKIVEMLLSQERVLALLYDKTFPTKQDEEKKEGESKPVAAMDAKAQKEPEKDQERDSGDQSSSINT